MNKCVRLALLTLVVGLIVSALPAAAQCDDIFNNFSASSAFYSFTDPVTQATFFDAGTCNGMQYFSAGDLLVTGDLVLFNVAIGQTVTFSTCGSAVFDSYIRVWNASDLTLVAQNDDDAGCGPNNLASTVTWTSTFDGQIWVGVTESPCDPNGQLVYDLSFSCSPESCGNGIVDAGEDCDDGNMIDGDGCTANCVAEFCGDGVVQAGLGEQCDDGNNTDADGCQGNCLLPVCGDGIVDPGEQCDDGNNTNADGCQGNCLLPVCGDGIVDPGEQCDDGNNTNADGCQGNCQLPACGDGILDAGEQCDDGNNTNADGCQGNCLLPTCGDGILDDGEQCDDGNVANADGCQGNCLLPVCGDGITDAGEGCDDGNNVDLDGCSAGCRPEGACCSNGAGTDSECFVTNDLDCATNHSLYLGDGSECVADIDCVALVVTFDSLSATATPDGVWVRWTTALETDTVGFRVLRQARDARSKTPGVVSELILAQGHGLSGASYEVLDSSPEAGDAVHYFLEDIDIFGKVTRHGPIVIERGARVAPTTGDGRRAGSRR